MATLPKGRLERRLHGLETEYGVRYRFNGDYAQISPGYIAHIFGMQFEKQVATLDVIGCQLVRNVGQMFGLPIAGLSYFLENGSRCYLDFGFHPEYSTAECESIANVVHSDLAGELVLERSARLTEEKLLEHGIPVKIDLLKNNTNAKGTSWGCHENYTVKRDVAFLDYAYSLIPFFVTRQIFSGAGRVYDVRNRRINYQIGARSSFITTDIGGATSTARAIINTRDEPHADPERYRRLHVIVGESNMGDVPTYLKICTTAIVLDLIEEGIIDDAFRKSVALVDPVRAIRQVAEDMTCKKTELRGWKKNLSPLEIQRAYFDLALKHKDVLEPSYLPGLDKWGELLDVIEKNPMDAGQDIDWVYKWLMIQNFFSRNSQQNLHRAGEIDLKYHNIVHGRGYYRGRIKDSNAPFGTDQTLVQRLVEHPPQEERARFRSGYVRLMQELGCEYQENWVADWAFLYFKTNPNSFGEYGFMPEIHGNDREKLRNFFLRTIPEQKRSDPDVQRILQETFQTK